MDINAAHSLDDRPSDSFERQDGGETAVDRLVLQIRGYIRDNGLAVGDVLPTERELCERFGAGRNTVREALRIVRAYGIVEVRPKVGAVIADRHEAAAQALFAFQQEVSPASFLDVQGFRKINEIGIGDHLILNLSDADFDRLHAVNDRIAAGLSVDEASDLDFAFHEALVALAGNRTLLTNYRLLRPVVTRIMRLGKSARETVDTTREAHAEILAALKARDRIAYSYLVSRHLDFGLRFLGPSDSA
jgi:DNA-binding FadR family transcriptional regulator